MKEKNDVSLDDTWKRCERKGITRNKESQGVEQKMKMDDYRNLHVINERRKVFVR